MMIKNYVIVFLLTGIVFVFLFMSFKRYQDQTEQNGAITGINDMLQEKLKMSATITKEKIIYQYKNAEQKVITKIKYLPIEGSAELTIDNNDNVDVVVKNKGFCVKPLISLFYDNKLQFGAGIRFFYWNRWGLGTGVSQEFKPYLNVDRRMNDILPFDNVSLGICGGKDILSATISVYL